MERNLLLAFVYQMISQVTGGAEHLPWACRLQASGISHLAVRGAQQAWSQACFGAVSSEWESNQTQHVKWKVQGEWGLVTKINSKASLTSARVLSMYYFFFMKPQFTLTSFQAHLNEYGTIPSP